MNIKKYKKVLKEVWESLPEKSRYIMFYILGFISCLFIWLMSSSSLKELTQNYPKDNIVEQALEYYKDTI